VVDGIVPAERLVGHKRLAAHRAHVVLRWRWSVLVMVTVHQHEEAEHHVLLLTGCPLLLVPRTLTLAPTLGAPHPCS
jgi:hypothetical protein